MASTFVKACDSRPGLARTLPLDETGLSGRGWPQNLISASLVCPGFTLAKLTSASERRLHAHAVYVSLSQILRCEINAKSPVFAVK